MIKQIKLLKNFLNHFLVDVKLGCKHQQKVVIFSLILLLYYIVNNIKKSECRWLYRDSPDWIKNRKATIKFINDDNECFQYAATVTNHKEIGKNSNIKNQAFYKKV